MVLVCPNARNHKVYRMKDGEVYCEGCRRTYPLKESYMRVKSGVDFLVGE